MRIGDRGKLFADQGYLGCTDRGNYVFVLVEVLVDRNAVADIIAVGNPGTAGAAHDAACGGFNNVHDSVDGDHALIECCDGLHTIDIRQRRTAQNQN